MELNSNHNKELLWNILVDNGIFYDIPDDKYNFVKQLFENILLKYDYNIENKVELLNINKKIISELVNNINSYKNALKNNDFSDFNKKYSSNFISSMSIKDNYINKKIENFDENVEKYKENINNMLNPKLPEEIDFKDTNIEDKPIDNDSMNNMLEKLKYDRNIIETNEANETNKENVENVENVENKKYENDNIPKLKISNINDLFEENVEVINLKKSENKINKNLEKIKTNNNIDYYTTNEYNSEYKFNINNKLDTLFTKVNELLTNQNLILNKLNLNNN